MREVQMELDSITGYKRKSKRKKTIQLRSVQQNSVTGTGVESDVGEMDQDVVELQQKCSRQATDSSSSEQ